nr:MAG TPA: hypothetical protein [Caudoviricetes sp.]
MARNTDLIELASNGDDVIVDDSDSFIGEDCVTIASFKNMGDGEGWKKFHEQTFEGMLDFCASITGILTSLKFTKFEMVGYAVLHNSIKILDLENYALRVRIRVVISGFKADLDDLKDIYSEAV